MERPTDAELLASMMPWIWKMAIRILKPPFEDAVQTVSLHVLKEAHRYDHLRYKPLTYFHPIIVRELRKIKRRDRTIVLPGNSTLTNGQRMAVEKQYSKSFQDIYELPAHEQPAGREQEPGVALEERDTLKAVREALKQLPREQRTVLDMRTRGVLWFVVARKLRISINRARHQYQLAVGKLREILSNSMPDGDL